MRQAAEPTAAPVRLTDFKGLPLAWIGVGDIDLFCDEDIAYARRLIAAGVHAELLVMPGAYHSFDNIAAGSRAASLFTSEWRRALLAALAA